MLCTHRPSQCRAGQGGAGLRVIVARSLCTIVWPHGGDLDLHHGYPGAREPAKPASAAGSGTPVPGTNRPQLHMHLLVVWGAGLQAGMAGAAQLARSRFSPRANLSP